MTEAEVRARAHTYSPEVWVLLKMMTTAAMIKDGSDESTESKAAVISAHMEAAMAEWDLTAAALKEEGMTDEDINGFVSEMIDDLRRSSDWGRILSTGTN